MKPEVLCVGVVMTISLLIASTVAVKSEAGSNVKDRWFSSLTAKETPLWVCEGFTEGVLYRIPPIKRCKLLNNPLNSSAINITIWWEDIMNQEIDAHECIALLSPVHCFWAHYRGCVYTYLPDVTLPMTLEECKQMVETNVAPDGTKLERIREGYWGTDDNRLPAGSYFSVDKLDRKNYYVRELKVVINNFDNTVMTLASVLETCHGGDGHCQTSEGYLIWPPEQHHQCRLKEGQTTRCLWTDDVISCPEISFSLTDIAIQSICDHKITMSSEGVYFTPVEPQNGIFSEAMTTQEAREKVMKGRVRREQSFITATEYNTRTRFILEMIEEQLDGEIQILHQEMCRMATLRLEVLHNLV
jgi:hypothetical protein